MGKPYEVFEEIPGNETVVGGVIFTRTRIGPIDGKGHCVEYARIFLHEKQANRPGRSVYRRYSYVCIKTPQPRLVSILRANQGIHRVQHQNARVGQTSFCVQYGIHCERIDTLCTRLLLKCFQKLKENSVEMDSAMVIAKYCILEIGGVVW